VSCPLGAAMLVVEPLLVCVCAGVSHVCHAVRVECKAIYGTFLTIMSSN